MNGMHRLALEKSHLKLATVRNAESRHDPPEHGRPEPRRTVNTDQTPMARGGRYTLAADIEIQALGPHADVVVLNMKTGAVFKLNPSAGVILSRLRDGAALDNIVGALLEHYAVDRATAEHETLALVDRLLSDGLVVPHDAVR